MKYIYDTPQWPHFSWDHELVSDALARVNKEAGFLAGRLSAIGLDARMGAVVETVTQLAFYCGRRGALFGGPSSWG